MSYLVLARKYRPRSFDTLVGQEHVVRALTHALSAQRLHHAYLFTGTRGVGKTTLSRILAKSLNCEGADGQGGITATPCGVCRACTEIDAGRFVDYVEMDAASNRGVDEMAQLLEQAAYQPAAARFKVYMIDEVHMLTNHAFNAMLKTLEEPPPYVKFILATTDPQKIPATVLSRCLQFNLKQMPPVQIVDHLNHILTLEAISHEAGAIRLLARAAQGSMRDALSLTDQAIAYCAGSMTEEAVRGMLGALDQTYLLRLLEALAAQEGPTLMQIAQELAARSVALAGVLQDLASLLQQIALAQIVAEAVDDSQPEAESIQRLARAVSPELVQLWYQIAIHGRHDLPLAPDEFAGFSMTLLRMLAFQPHQPQPQPGKPTQYDAASTSLSAGTPTELKRPPATAPTQPRAAVSTNEGMNGATIAATSAVTRPVSPARAALEAVRGYSSKTTEASASRAERTTSPSSSVSSGRQPPSGKSATGMPVSMGLATSAATSASLSVQDSALTNEAERVSPLVTTPLNVAEVIPFVPKQENALTRPSLAVDWPELMLALNHAGRIKALVRELAYQSECVATEGDHWTIQVAAKPLIERGNPDKLAEAIKAHLGRAIRLTVEMGPAQHTAAQRLAVQQAAAQQAAEVLATQDPLVQLLINRYDAKIVADSIKPQAQSLNPSGKRDNAQSP